MKTILGAVAVSWLLFVACGGDGGSSSSPGGPDGNSAGEGGGSNSGEGSTTAGTGDTTGSPGGAGGEGTALIGTGGGTDATAGAAGASAGVELSPVSGKILSATGVALPAAVVLIGGASTVTDDDGSFTIADVTPSYDLTVIYEDDAAHIHDITVVDGLTTHDLTLRLALVRHTDSSTKVSGKLAPPIAKAREGLVQVSGPQGYSPPQSLVAGAAAFALEPSWEGGTTTSADVIALEWTPGKTGPASYTGFAREKVSLSDGVAAVVNLALAKPAQKTINGTLSLAGAAAPQTSLNFGAVSLPLALEAGPFSVVVPDVGEPSYLSLSSNKDNVILSTFVATTVASPELAVAAPPKLVLPVENAKVTPNTEYSFTRAGGLAGVTWAIGKWFVYRVTPETKVRLPDLSSAGVAWDDALALGGMWAVELYDSAETPEEFLSLRDGTSHRYSDGVVEFSQIARTLSSPPL